MVSFSGEQGDVQRPERERERESEEGKVFNWIYGQLSVMVPARLHKRLRGSLQAGEISSEALSVP